MSDIRRILLVDDSVNDVKLMVSAIRGAGLVNEIEVCRDGAEALDCLFRRAAPPGA